MCLFFTAIGAHTFFLTRGPKSLSPALHANKRFLTVEKEEFFFFVSFFLPSFWFLDLAMWSNAPHRSDEWQRTLQMAVFEDFEKQQVKGMVGLTLFVPDEKAFSGSNSANRFEYEGYRRFLLKDPQLLWLLLTLCWRWKDCCTKYQLRREVVVLPMSRIFARGMETSCRGRLLPSSRNGPLGCQSSIFLRSLLTEKQPVSHLLLTLPPFWMKKKQNNKTSAWKRDTSADHVDFIF